MLAPGLRSSFFHAAASVRTARVFAISAAASASGAEGAASLPSMKNCAMPYALI
jgi:hypothetical protein